MANKNSFPNLKDMMRSATRHTSDDPQHQAEEATKETTKRLDTRIERTTPPSTPLYHVGKVLGIAGATYLITALIWAWPIPIALNPLLVFAGVGSFLLCLCFPVAHLAVRRDFSRSHEWGNKFPVKRYYAFLIGVVILATFIALYPSIWALIPTICVVLFLGYRVLTAKVS